VQRDLAVDRGQLLDEPRDRAVRLDVVDTVHQQRLARSRAAALVLDLLLRAGHRRAGVEHDPRRVAVPLRRQVHHQHAGSVGRVPPVFRVRPAEAAPQDRIVQPELPPDLRHLPDVAEEIRQIADRHRRTELARDGVAADEVAHE
jgi:hypothetical protein